MCNRIITKGIFSNESNMFYVYRGDVLKIFNDIQEIVFYPNKKFFEILSYVANNVFDKMVQLPNAFMVREFLYKEGLSAINLFLYDNDEIIFEIFAGGNLNSIQMTKNEFDLFFERAKKHFEMIINR
nr:MAG TPA: hypothetical protein [Caudoviricetes sp.]